MPETQEKRQPIRLLTVITKLELGGAQQVALHTLRGLDSGQYRKFLIAGRGGLLEAEARSLPDVTVHLWRAFAHPIRPCRDALTFWRLLRFMQKERIQIVHTHSSKAGFLGRLAAWAAGVPVIIHTVHGWPFHAYQSWLSRHLYITLERLAARVSTRLLAVSQATLKKGEENHIGASWQYRVVLPASELGGFAPGGEADRRSVRREFGFAPDARLVGLVACLKKQKAPQDFVRAARVVLDQLPEARFLMVGDGRERKSVHREIRRLALAGKVVVAGWRQDVPRLMRALDILALSSRWEGLPCVLAQAMASGVPVVATQVEGIQEAVEHEATGLLVPPGQPAALGQALAALLQDPEKCQRLRKNALDRISPFGIQPMLNSLQTVYQEAWEEKTQPQRRA